MKVLEKSTAMETNVYWEVDMSKTSCKTKDSMNGKELVTTVEMPDDVWEYLPISTQALIEQAVLKTQKYVHELVFHEQVEDAVALPLEKMME